MWIAGSSLYLLLAGIGATPVITFTYFLGSGIGTAIGATIISLIVGVFGGLPLGRKVSKLHTRLEEEAKKLMPPHEYDNNIKFWEAGDLLKIEREDSVRTRKKYFLGFNNDGEAVIADDVDVNKEKIESGDYHHEDLKDLEKIRIQDLDDYKNVTNEDRMEDLEKRKILSELDNSYYNKKLKQLAEVERQKNKELRRIHDSSDNEELSLEELDQKLLEEEGVEASQSNKVKA